MSAQVTGPAPCSRACLRESSWKSRAEKEDGKGMPAGSSGPAKECLQPRAAAQGSPGNAQTTDTCQSPRRNAGHKCFQFHHLQRHHLPPPGICASVIHMCMHALCSSLLQESGSPLCLSLRRAYSRGGQGAALLWCQEQHVCRCDPSIPVVRTQIWGGAYRLLGLLSLLPLKPYGLPPPSSFVSK